MTNSVCSCLNFGAFQQIIDEISGWYSPESMQAAIQDLNATTDKRGKGSLMYEEFVQVDSCVVAQLFSS